MINDRVKRAAAKVAGHLATPRPWRPPTWLLYLIGALALLALLYGGIQQARIWRWSRLLSASKERIATLEARETQARYQGSRQATSRAVKQLDKRKGQLQTRLKDQARTHRATTRKIPKMSPEQLRRAFAEEGF